MRLLSFALIAISVAGLTSAQSSNPTREAELAADRHRRLSIRRLLEGARLHGQLRPRDLSGRKAAAVLGLFLRPGWMLYAGHLPANTTLLGDDKYWVIDLNTIEVGGCGKYAGQFTRYVRCPGREVPDDGARPLRSARREHVD